MQLMSTVDIEHPGKREPLSLLFWGTESLFSQQVLSHLLPFFTPSALFLPARAAEQHPVQRLAREVQPSSSDELSLLTQFVSTTTLHTAWQHDLPVYALRTVAHADVRELLQELAPDLVCVACFPWRVPTALLTIPTHGFVNLHPSLLPAYRGPAPLFWQLRDGLQQSGVTLHRMDQRFDTGDILAQQSLPLAEGASGPMLDRDYAQLASKLLIDCLTDLATRGALTGQPQTSRGSRHSWPQATDFALDRTWSARHAFNFMRGCAEWRHPFSVRMADATYLLNEARRYNATATLPTPVSPQGEEIAIQFNPGVLYATIAHT